MKIRSESELEDFISQQFSWRQHELTNFKNMTFTSRNAMRNTLLKMFVVLLYSHWEGFVKIAAISYCEFLNSKGIKYNQLQNNFRVYCVLNKFQGDFPPNKFSSYLEILNMNSELDENLSINTEKYITTQSNLNSDVLRDIVQKLGFSYTEYELQANLIDQNFLELRNAIAHGEYRLVDEKIVEMLYEEIMSLINCFKNQILNSVYNKSYLSGE